MSEGQTPPDAGGYTPLDIDEPLVAPFTRMRDDRRDELFVVEGELAVGRLLDAAPRFEVGCVVCTPARAQRIGEPFFLVQGPKNNADNWSWHRRNSPIFPILAALLKAAQHL